MFDDLMGRVAGRFARVEPRRRAGAFVLGLLADLPRKNCWTIAEHAGDATPDGMQHLLAASSCGSDCLCPNARLASIDEIATLLATACIEVIGSPIGFQALDTPTKYEPDLRPEQDSNLRPTA